MLDLDKVEHTQTSSNYDYTMVYSYRTISSNAGSASYGAAEDQAFGRIYDWNFHGEDYPMVFKITTMAEMQNTTRHKTFSNRMCRVIDIVIIIIFIVTQWVSLVLKEIQML